MGNLEATVALLNAASQALLGVNAHTEANWTREWTMPGFDLATNSRLVLAPDGRMAAFALVWDVEPHNAPECWGRVHPDHAGRGLGAYLLRWAEARDSPL